MMDHETRISLFLTTSGRFIPSIIYDFMAVLCKYLTVLLLHRNAAVCELVLTDLDSPRRPSVADQCFYFSILIFVVQESYNSPCTTEWIETPDVYGNLPC